MSLDWVIVDSAPSATLGPPPPGDGRDPALITTVEEFIRCLLLHRGIVHAAEARCSPSATCTARTVAASPADSYTSGSAPRQSTCRTTRMVPPASAAANPHTANFGSRPVSRQGATGAKAQRSLSFRAERGISSGVAWSNEIPRSARNDRSPRPFSYLCLACAFARDSVLPNHRRRR